MTDINPLGAASVLPANGGVPQQDLRSAQQQSGIQQPSAAEELRAEASTPGQPVANQGSENAPTQRVSAVTISAEAQQRLAAESGNAVQSTSEQQTQGAGNSLQRQINELLGESQPSATGQPADSGQSSGLTSPASGQERNAIEPLADATPSQLSPTAEEDTAGPIQQSPLDAPAQLGQPTAQFPGQGEAEQPAEAAAVELTPDAVAAPEQAPADNSRAQLNQQLTEGTRQPEQRERPPETANADVTGNPLAVG